MQRLFTEPARAKKLGLKSLVCVWFILLVLKDAFRDVCFMARCLGRMVDNSGLIGSRAAVGGHRGCPLPWVNPHHLAILMGTSWAGAPSRSSTWACVLRESVCPAGVLWDITPSAPFFPSLSGLEKHTGSRKSQRRTASGKAGQGAGLGRKSLPAYKPADQEWAFLGCFYPK